MISCLEFTTETQSDFISGTLPTLDFQTRILDNGEIDFTHFTKPMANNILLESNTALSKATIFSALRQDLIRRLLHTRRQTPWEERIKIIEDYTRLLANSGHKYSFSKSIILQAITKYEWMVERSLLEEKDRRYLPLYRNKGFDQPRRKILKYILPSVWYTDDNIKDPYRNQWKNNIKRSFDRKKEKRISNWQSKHESRSKRVTSTMFVPSSEEGLLMKKVKEKEESIAASTSWRIKILEKSGVPLSQSLSRNF